MTSQDNIVYHRQVKSHTGMVWECLRNPDDPAVKQEISRLVAAGGIVVTKPESPGNAIDLGEALLSVLGVLSGGLLWLLLSFVLGRAVLAKFLTSAWDANWHEAAAAAVAILAGSGSLIVGAFLLACLFHSMALGSIPRHMR